MRHNRFNDAITIYSNHLDSLQQTLSLLEEKEKKNEKIENERENTHSHSLPVLVRGREQRELIHARQAVARTHKSIARTYWQSLSSSMNTSSLSSFDRLVYLSYATEHYHSAMSLGLYDVEIRRFFAAYPSLSAVTMGMSVDSDIEREELSKTESESVLSESEGKSQSIVLSPHRWVVRHITPATSSLSSSDTITTTSTGASDPLTRKSSRLTSAIDSSLLGALGGLRVDVEGTETEEVVLEGEEGLSGGGLSEFEAQRLYLEEEQAHAQKIEHAREEMMMKAKELANQQRRNSLFEEMQADDGFIR